MRSPDFNDDPSLQSKEIQAFAPGLVGSKFKNAVAS